MPQATARSIIPVFDIKGNGSSITFKKCVKIYYIQSSFLLIYTKFPFSRILFHSILWRKYAYPREGYSLSTY